jgi:hypothetical protein
MAAPLLMVFFGTNSFIVSVAIGLFMFAISANSNVSMSMTTTVFGRNDFENAWPDISVIYKLVASSGVVIVALIAEKTSYRTSFMAIAGFVFISMIIMLSTKSKCITSVKEEKSN